MFDSPDILIERCRSGDQLAAQELFESYADRLLAKARRRISQRMASRIDAEDVVQEVFVAFFMRLRNGHIQVVHGENGLFRLLAHFTELKALRQVTHHLAAKRDRRNDRLQGEVEGVLSSSLAGAREPAADVAFLDQLEFFRRRLLPIDRQILDLRLQGFSTIQIARQLNTYDRKIRRALERIRDLLEHEDWSSNNRQRHRQSYLP